MNLAIKDKGFSLLELMMVIVIFSIMVAAIYTMLTSGQAAWLTTDVQVQLQQDLRQTLEKVSKELRETGSDKTGIMQVTIFDNIGISSSDIIRFSMPVICKAGMNVIDLIGDVAYWGAPLTWGCTQSSCMDKDEDCLTVEYKFVEYRLNASNQLVRRVLNAASGIVREDIFAENIVSFQTSLSADKNVITLNVTVQKETDLNRLMTASNSLDVFLRNRGGLL